MSGASSQPCPVHGRDPRGIGDGILARNRPCVDRLRPEPVSQRRFSPTETDAGRGWIDDEMMSLALL